MLLLLSMAFPLFGAFILALLRTQKRSLIHIVTLLFTCLGSACALYACFKGDDTPVQLLRFTDSLDLSLRLYGTGRVFSALAAFLWPLSTLYAFGYMTHEEGEGNFFVFYQLSFTATLGIAFASDLLTMYVFYEMLTLSTLPLIAHGSLKERIRASRKYIIYMLSGASVGFIAMALVLFQTGNVSFLRGGALGVSALSPATARIVFLLAFLGFGVKAAIFPLHGWLPAASVAPTPVTALLHAVAVVKAGVFAMMRVGYDVLDPSIIRGSWAQYASLAMALLSILFGSGMAIREEHLKRRLAYSTMSNLSYVLLGVLLLTPQGLEAGLMHMVFHAMMKITLFCCVGAMMTRAKVSYLQEIRGLNRRMPVICAIFLFCAVSLMGIPPFVGFQSKWALAQAALASGNLIGVCCCGVLLISALFTAIYMLTPAISAYLSPRRELPSGHCAAGIRMTAPLLLLCALMLVLAFYSKPLTDVLRLAANGLL